ncbi:MAG: hypothetical protein QF824_03600 [Candidatus Woesearchaeota archaeon]|jgi:hypothetical protein|nr:hypothetical protein [Candidatus Woesearchaeota archaeon]
MASKIKLKEFPKKETKLNFNHIILAVVVITLAVSIYTLTEVNKLKGGTSDGQTVSTEQFLRMLTAHPEASSYVNIPPLNIVRIDETNLANIQAQIEGVDPSYIGKYIVQYTDRLIIYDFDNDIVIGNVDVAAPQNSQLPQDFSAKLVAHTEVADVANEDPSGGLLDAASLDTLRQQYPDVYKDAKVGDYLLRYSDRLIIYDYQNDAVVGAFALR